MICSLFFVSAEMIQQSAQVSADTKRTEIMNVTSFFLQNAGKRASDPIYRIGSGLELLERLEAGERLEHAEFAALLSETDPAFRKALRERAERVRRKVYGNTVFVRGLVEFTNYCKNDCLYCGIRRSNCKAQRYRLSKEEILGCCQEGYVAGFRTFVLQGGEDGYFTDERVADLVSEIKHRWPECAVTLSIGERSRESYETFYRAGADRYLLRHETADDAHYRMLHPEEMTLENRKRCLRDLKDIGFQTGAGIMVGTPGQTADTIASDLVFMQELQPEMVGIGPFLPHKDTPFGGEPAGSVELTLDLLAIVRLMLPKALLPATTALGTAEADGRERGMRCGANVVMPNLSPASVRSKYMLYDNKLSTGSESAEGLRLLTEKMAAVGLAVVKDRGDYQGFVRKACCNENSRTGG